MTDEIRTRIFQRGDPKESSAISDHGTGEAGRWVFRDGRLVKVAGEDSESYAHHIQTDEIPPTVSHATDEGLVFTSRAKLNAHLAAHGMGMMDKGEFLRRNQEAAKRKPSTTVETERAAQERRETVLRAINDLRYGNVPLSERERETCNREIQNGWSLGNRNRR
jgi:hypothetical protein